MSEYKLWHRYDVRRAAPKVAIKIGKIRRDGCASDITGKIAELEAAGKTTLRQIAEGLNAAGIPTARGEGEWSAVQVQRVQVRLHVVA